MGKKITGIFLLFIILFLSLYESVLWIIGGSGRVSPYFINIIIFVLVVVTIFVLGSFKTKNDGKKIYVKKDNSNIMITENAITQLVKNTLDGIEAITKSEIVIKYDREKSIILDLLLALKVGSNIIEVTKMSEELVIKAFTESLDESVKEIRITVSGFTS